MERRPTWLRGREAGAPIDGAPKWWKENGGPPSDMGHSHGQSHGAVCCQPSGSVTQKCDIPRHLRELIEEGVISESQATKIVERETKLATPKDPIYGAAAEGDFSLLQQALAVQQIPTAVDESGKSVLHWAAESGNVAMVQWLLQHGAPVSARDPTSSGASPLHTAAVNGHYKVVQALVDEGKAEVMAKDDEGQTALHRACAAASIPCAALLLSLGAHVDAVDDFGMTPLACVFAEREASDAQTGQLVHLLVEMGASINRADADGNTPLHHASATIRYGAVSVLVERGATITTENSAKDIPLDVVAKGVTTMERFDQRRGAMIVALLRPHRTIRGVERLFGLWASPKGKQSTRNLVFFLPFIWLAVAGYVGEVIGPVFFGPKPFGYVTVARLGAAFGIVVVTINMVNVCFALIGQHMAFIMNGLVWAQCALMYFTLVVWFGPRISTPLTPVSDKDAIAGPLVLVLIAIGTVVLFRSAYMVRKYEKYNIVKGVPDLRGRHELIKRVGKQGKLDTNHFDFSSFAERPLRSKHADYLPAWGPAVVRSELYARFDHYCPFSDCVVGQRNHVYFFQYVLAIVGMSILFVYLSVRFVVKDYGPTGAHSVVFSVLRWLVCRPWVTWVGGNAALHATWATCLFFDQLNMAVMEDLTTNEKINAHKYDYVSRSNYGSFRPSPWSLGPMGNLKRLIGGMRDPDYRKVFTTPDQQFSV
eukprot:m.120374 g.120374  ORF g.120374 m.120374 type:complete len:707 (-) comp13342_c0_seq2:2644-4764(-)